MDMESGKQQLLSSLKKYQYVFWVILAGVLLMMLPETAEEPKIELVAEETVSTDLEQELSEILSQIYGVGKAEVLLTEATGSHTIYQTDSGPNQSNQDTVIVQKENREETGLIKQVLPPVYKGALVVCQGADSPGVQLAVVDAVKSVTGISSDCITVLKMK